MGNELTIPQILTLAKACEYISSVNVGRINALKGGALDNNISTLIYMERMSVQNRYNLNPLDATLRSTANYLFSVLKFISQAQVAVFNAAQAKAAVTGPANQSGNVGFNAAFTVAVTSATPYTIAWFRNGVLIPGQIGLTYTLSNAQLSDSGSVFFAQVTNGAGISVSATATLTVTAALVGSFYQGSTDFSTQLLASTDNVTYLGTFPITTGQPFTVTFPHLGADEFIVVKYPATEPTKANYLNPPPSGPDAGSIPSIALEGTSFGGSKYILSRTGNPFGMNSVNGQVKFS